MCNGYLFIEIAPEFKIEIPEALGIMGRPLCSVIYVQYQHMYRSETHRTQTSKVISEFILSSTFHPASELLHPIPSSVVRALNKLHIYQLHSTRSSS